MREYLEPEFECIKFNFADVLNNDVVTTSAEGDVNDGDGEASEDW